MDEESRSRKHEYWNLVVVLVPEGARDDVLGEVEALMAPYDCGVPVDIYREPCGCVGLEAREEGFELAVETVLVRDPGRRRRWWTLNSDDEEIYRLGVGRVGLDVTARASLPALRALHLQYLDSLGLQVASESCPVAAGT